MFSIAVLLTIAWGALAFGAVYPWAHQPLLAALVVLGVWGLFGPTGSGRRRANGPIAIGLALFVAALVLQLVPLPRQTLLAISPAADTLLQRYDLAYATLPATGQSITHPLSIQPAQTRLGLMLVLGLGVFLLGLTRLLDGSRLCAIVPGLIVLGVVLALAGIIQKATYQGKIYGFWTPHFAGDPFGPFVNKNHFAGWMLMAWPLAIGYFSAQVARGLRGVKPGWREHILWFSTREANQTILVGFAILVMGLSLVMTFSRSGITCFAIALLLSGIAVVRRQVARSKRAALLSYLVFVAFVSLTWAGLDVIVGRFQAVDLSLGGRFGAWQDALSIFRAFPWTGSGLNTYGTVILFYQTHFRQYWFGEAHNDYLQLLAEGGLLVAIPTLILIGLFVREVRRRFREGLDDRAGYWLRLGAVTSIVAIALQEIGEFSLQMPGNAALFVLLCGVAVRKVSAGGGRATAGGGSGPRPDHRRARSPRSQEAGVVSAQPRENGVTQPNRQRAQLHLAT